MTAIGWAQIALVLAAVLAAALPLSAYIARVLAGERTFLSPVLTPVERVFYNSPASIRRGSRAGSSTRWPCSPSA